MESYCEILNSRIGVSYSVFTRGSSLRSPKAQRGIPRARRLPEGFFTIPDRLEGRLTPFLAKKSAKKFAKKMAKFLAVIYKEKSFRFFLSEKLELKKNA